MANTIGTEFAELLLNKAATPVQLTDSFKDLYESYKPEQTEWEAQLKNTGGAAGLFGTMTGVGETYAGWIAAGGGAQRWLGVSTKSLGGVGVVSSGLLLVNDLETNGWDVEKTKTNSWLGTAGAIAGTAALFATGPLGLLALGGAILLTGGSIVVKDEVKLGQTLDQLRNLLGDNPSEADISRIAGTVDAMLSPPPGTFAVPDYDPITGGIIGFHSEVPLTSIDLGQGRMIYEFSGGLILEKPDAYSYSEPWDGTYPIKITVKIGRAHV